MKLSKRQVEKQIEAAYKRIANGVPIPIMKLGALFSESQADVLAGMSVDDAVTKAVNKYKV